MVWSWCNHSSTTFYKQLGHSGCSNAKMLCVLCSWASSLWQRRYFIRRIFICREKFMDIFILEEKLLPKLKNYCHNWKKLRKNLEKKESHQILKVYHLLHFYLLQNHWFYFISCSFSFAPFRVSTLHFSDAAQEFKATACFPFWQHLLH